MFRPGPSQEAGRVEHRELIDSNKTVGVQTEQRIKDVTGDVGGGGRTEEPRPPRKKIHLMK